MGASVAQVSWTQVETEHWTHDFDFIASNAAASSQSFNQGGGFPGGFGGGFSGSGEFRDFLCDHKRHSTNIALHFNVCHN